MKFLRRLFGKAQPEPDAGDNDVQLAFVLLSDAQAPDPQEVVRHFRAWATDGEQLAWRPPVEGEGDIPNAKPLSFELSTGEQVFIALMPIAVPEGEADRAYQFSLSSFQADSPDLPRHTAHLLVTMTAPGVRPLDRLHRFTSLLAAILQSAPGSIGVYWGNAGATHRADFFLELATEPGCLPRIALWNGVSRAAEDGKLSLLSLGMQLLDQPDLLLIAGEDSQNDAVETAFSFLSYVAQRGEPIAEGHTIGRTPEEKLPIRYVPSPIDGDVKVWRIELP